MGQERAQAFEEFTSKHLNIDDQVKVDKPDGAASILDEVDFEVELIQRDKIKVAYILALLSDAFEEADSLDPKVRDGSEVKKKTFTTCLALKGICEVSAN